MAIKKIDPNARFELVTAYDDALVFETDEEIAAAEKEGRQVRYQEYLKDVDLSKLMFKEGEKPTIFVVRCLLAEEIADVSSRYLVVDTVAKTQHYKDRNKMMLEYFKLGCLGIKGDKGQLEPTSADEVGFNIALDIGAQISLLTTLKKNLKKP